MTRAQAYNIIFDELVSAKRQSCFESLYFDSEETLWPALAKRQSEYVRRYIETNLVPHTFDPIMQPHGLGTLDEEQRLVRLELLKRPLNLYDISYPEFADAFSDNADELIQGFLDVWNLKRDQRPAFATFRREVSGDAAASDWAERLRDRLGLAHYDTAGGAEPVAMLQYSVKEVLAEAQTAFAVTVPTVLDSKPWPHFFPAPRELQCGRAMALSPCEDQERLVAEVLHSRITYRKEHIAAITELTTPAPRHGIGELRELHLLALQILSGRADYGT